MSYADLSEILSDGIEHQPFSICPSPNGTYTDHAYTAFQTVASTRVGSLHHASFPFQMLTVLSPFATRWAFPISDYYGDSVPLELSFRRESQVP